MYSGASRVNLAEFVEYLGQPAVEQIIVWVGIRVSNLRGLESSREDLTTRESRKSPSDQRYPAGPS